MDEMAVPVKKDVAVMPVLYLQEVSDDRISYLKFDLVSLLERCGSYLLMTARNSVVHEQIWLRRNHRMTKEEHKYA